MELPLDDRDGSYFSHDREQLTVEIQCSSCRQYGSAVWEGLITGGHPETLGRRLVNLSDGFHAESGRTRSLDPLVGCNECDNFEIDGTAVGVGSFLNPSAGKVAINPGPSNS